MKVALSSIERDSALQIRAKPIQEHLVREYAEAMKRGETFPPVVLFVDDQGRHWLGDGWHRVFAADSLALSEIEADVRPGGRRAAFMHALGANDSHGARRTQKDRQNSIRKALSDTEIRQMSDREIGRLCGVDHKSVGKVRATLKGGELFDSARRGKDGKVYRRSVSVGISPPAQKTAFGSALGGAGGEQARRDGFNIMQAMPKLEGQLAEDFKTWPEEKRHAFCVTLRNFAIENDPEIRERQQDAFDEMLMADDEKRRRAARGEFKG